ncbi:MAG: ATP-dependent Clp protease ATP-binding subunit [Chloroflexota bacterium]
MTPSPDIPEKEIRERCSRLLRAAADEARKLGHNYIGTEHLFMAATRNEQGVTCHLLRQAELNPRDVRNEIRREIGTGEGIMTDVLPLTPRSEMVLSLAIFLADQDKTREINEGQLLMALLQEGEGVPVRKLIDMGFDINHWLQVLITQDDAFPPAMTDEDEAYFLDESESDFDFDISDGIFGANDKRNTGAMPTPLLDKYGRDLTAQAANGKIGAAIAREDEIRAVARTLARSKKNNPLLLGDAGVGKTAVVEGLAYAIAKSTAPQSLLNMRIVQIEIGTLVAGTSLRGQFEERLVGIVEEIKNSGNCILFIDEIHTIVGAGDTIDSNLDAANILKPALARGEVKCIGATTHEEYRRAIAQDPALDRRFRTIDIEEPSIDDAIEILSGQRQRLEEHHGVVIRPETIETAVRLSVRYMPDRRLPDKALDLLDEACTRVIIRTAHPDLEDDAPNDVHVSDVTAVLSEWTGIPVSEMSTDERRRLAHLEEALHERVIGQDEAIRAVAAAVKTARAGLGDPNRPIGVFLFLGPSGVGKTELARALAEFMFGTEDAMLRLDMSEFHDAHTVARLIGSPPGYKDAQRGGQLTDGLRRRPYSVVLLDEVEKAAPEVFDIFLQVFDEGRISDSHGRSVDARHAVFIMTSNIGTQEGGRSMGFGGTNRDKIDYSGYLSQFFRPEFINRLDDVITFSPLDMETLSRILDLQLMGLRTRLSEQGLTLRLTAEARKFVLDNGFDSENGARPLRRAIERLITRPISAQIVDNAFAQGSTIVVYVNDDDRLEFRVEATTP